MFYDSEIDRIFQHISRSFGDLGAKTSGDVSGPICYGYTMTIGPDGIPEIKEYGNPKTGLLPTSQQDALVETLVDEKEKTVKLVAEMPGVEKTDFDVMVDNKVVSIDAQRGEKQYHAKVPIRHKVDQNSTKATYKNGILELTFKLLEAEKPKGKKVEVQ